MMNKGVVYALWSYEAQNSDELSFHEGDTITILRRKDESETEWWWARLGDREGFVPKNLLGVSPLSLLFQVLTQQPLRSLLRSCTQISRHRTLGIAWGPQARDCLRPPCQSWALGSHCRNSGVSPRNPKEGCSVFSLWGTSVSGHLTPVRTLQPRSFFNGGGGLRLPRWDSRCT